MHIQMSGWKIFIHVSSDVNARAHGSDRKEVEYTHAHNETRDMICARLSAANANH